VHNVTTYDWWKQLSYGKRAAMAAGINSETFEPTNTGKKRFWQTNTQQVIFSSLVEKI
jgi:hypothetical protein